MQFLVNLLTLSRIFFGVIIFLLISTKDYYWLALTLFLVAGITDYLDGYFARKHNLVSQFGEVIDPIADKILIVFLFFALSISLNSYFIAFIGSIIIAREIWVGALRDFNARYGKSGATKVTFLAKIKTTIQLFTISIYLFGLSINNMIILVFADIFLFLSMIITIYTGYQYTRNTFLG